MAGVTGKRWCLNGHGEGDKRAVKDTAGVMGKCWCLDRHGGGDGQVIALEKTQRG